MLIAEHFYVTTINSEKSNPFLFKISYFVWYQQMMQDYIH